ncbi:hypothetical protein [Natronorubrum thiooxidans]|uniref:Uncharacterized protein n=1 Tax=Natronorubrum thiooxidans TaxID=308853 RepID=A0A1N7H0N3_9EURY|nr:hypothetical protein [Natronorubrum thiooxidans]SIS18385.1 hypothetical protein SAMN05421752_1209 [Natronorubrum thiooxidans]
MERREYIFLSGTAFCTVSGCLDGSGLSTEDEPDEDDSENEREPDEDDSENEREPDEDDSSDTEGPTIHDFTLSGKTFEPGDSMKIDVEVADETDIERIYFRFEHENGGGAVFDAYRDFSPAVDDGTHTISYQWPENTPGGTYEITSISTRDSIGNFGSQTDSFSIDKRTIEIESKMSDTEAPIIHNFTLSGRKFEPGDSMKIDVDVTDETDIERIYFRFEHKDGGGAVFDAYRDFSPAVDDGTHTISYQWPENTSGGAYEITSISTRDSIGNFGSQTDSFSIDKRTIEIESETVDTEAPIVHDFTLSGRKFEPGDSMKIDVEVTDKTDIERIYFRFEHEDGGGAVFDAYRDFSPAVDDGTHTISYQWPENTPGGTYEITSISTRDSIGNFRSQTDSFSIDKRTIEIET